MPDFAAAAITAVCDLPDGGGRSSSEQGAANHGGLGVNFAGCQPVLTLDQGDAVGVISRAVLEEIGH